MQMYIELYATVCANHFKESIMDFSKQINDLIEKEEKNYVVEAKTLIDVFRFNFSSFEKLVYFYRTPVGKKYSLEAGLTAYLQIQKLLFDDFGEVTVSTIGNYMNKVRAERSEVSKANVTHMLATKPVKSRPGVAPVPVASTGAYVKPLPVSEHLDLAIKRLQKEESEGFKSATWDGRDEFFLMSILYPEYEKAKAGVLNPKFWSVVKSSSFTFSMSSMRTGMRQVESKLQRLNLWNHYKDLM